MVQSAAAMRLFAPDVYPTQRAELRAYTIAAFRVAQRSDQLSLVAMPKPIVEFLLKARAIGYWKAQGWLAEQEDGYRLTANGLVTCQSAIANELASHNTTADTVLYWQRQFVSNETLPRRIQLSH